MKGILKKLFGRPRLPEPWESIGSPTYSESVRRLFRGDADRMRRAAWDKRFILLAPNGRSLCARYDRRRFTDERLPEAWRHFYPPRHRLILVERPSLDYSDHRESWWSLPDEDIEADDWGVERFYYWNPARPARDLQRRGTVSKPRRVINQAGSPSYRNALGVAAAGGTRTYLRRSAWAEGECLLVDGDTDYLGGVAAIDIEWPPEGRVVHIHLDEARNGWGVDWWRSPQSEIEAEDWENKLWRDGWRPGPRHA